MAGSYTAETHPQRAKVVEMLMDTSRKWTCLQIAAALDPPLHEATISRFRRKILAHSTERLRPTVSNSNKLKHLAALATTDIDLEAETANLRRELHAAIARDSERRERWLAAAESTPILDREGRKVCDPDTKQPIIRMDHKALAAHDRNGLSSKELTARLGGLLNEAPTVVNNVLAVLSPSMPAASSSTAGSAVVDVASLFK